MPSYNRNKMSIDDLEEVHELYAANRVFWNFLSASYEGIRALIAGGFALGRHERESLDNHNRRIKEAYNFGYSSSVVDLFNFYLFRNPAKRDMAGLAKDKQWEKFEADCNLFGDNFLVWLLETQRWAGVLGHVGILIDKSSQNYQTAEEELNADVYPYVARYFPQAILDWKYGRDENNRPYLEYIKLRDDDGLYRIWTTEWWATYWVDDDLTGIRTTVRDVDTGQVRGGGGVKQEGDHEEVTALASGDNPFRGDANGGEIPFVWLYNVKSKIRPIGDSDIKNVAYIDRSIITNLSEGEEVITYGAFPMMRKPMEEAGKGPQNRGGQDDAGPTAVLEFDPEYPESKPDWLEAKVAEPIDAILRWIELKVSEIYRSTNVGGMAATEIQSEAKSGTALKAEFQLLNGKLVGKGNNVEEAEKAIKRFWCKWQGREDVVKDIVVEWPETYDVADLAQDLANALTAKTLVASKAFLKALQRQIVRSVLPNADNKLLDEIDKEIEEEVDNPKPKVVPAPPRGGQRVGGPVEEEGEEEDWERADKEEGGW
jgi:hypothetical protein